MIAVAILFSFLTFDSSKVCHSIFKSKPVVVEKSIPVIKAKEIDFSKVDLPDKEVYLIGQISEKYELTQEQKLLLCAIRKHEHGAPGKEFGVLSRAAQKYSDGYLSFIIQGEAAAQIILDSYSGDLVSFSRRYAPVGAENDPNNLNKFWYPIIKKLMEDWGQNTL
jgi:hypothetical protein